MIKYENQCCQCSTSSYPCVGTSCSKRKVPIFICDECLEETDILYQNENDTNERGFCLECFQNQENGKEDDEYYKKYREFYEQDKALSNKLLK